MMDKNNSRGNKVTTFIILLQIALVCLMWSNRSIFEFLNSYFLQITTVINIFIILVNFNDIAKTEMKQLAIVSIAMIITVFSLLFNNTGIGSVIVLLNIFLFYLYVTKIQLTRENIKYIASFVLILQIMFMFSDKSLYNTNTIGYVFFITTIFVFLMLNLTTNKLAKFLQMGMVLNGLVEMYKYECRSAMLGFVFFLFFSYFIPKKVLQKKVFYKAVCLVLTAGSLLWIYIYVYMWENNADFIIGFAQKSFFSGRQTIWIEVVEAFNNNILLGIGSKFIMTSYEFFECHNYILNMLAVYGVLVFSIFLYISLNYMIRAFKYVTIDKITRICLGGYLSTFLVGFFENNLSTTRLAIFSNILLLAVFSRYNYISQNDKERGAIDGQVNDIHSHIQ